MARRDGADQLTARWSLPKNGTVNGLTQLGNYYVLPTRPKIRVRLHRARSGSDQSVGVWRAMNAATPKTVLPSHVAPRKCQLLPVHRELEDAHLKYHTELTDEPRPLRLLQISEV